LERVPSWVEIGYSDSMDAWIYSEGHLKKYEDISTDILLGVVDEVAERFAGPERFLFTLVRRRGILGSPYPAPCIVSVPWRAAGPR